MKKTLIFIFLSLIGTTLLAQQNPLDNFFKKYEQDPSFTIINISPKMFNMFSKVNLNTGDSQAKLIMDVAKKLTGLQIITKENASNAQQLFQEAGRQLPKKYEELMTIRSDGSNMKFMINQGSDGVIHNLIMLMGGSNEFFAMSLTGNINLAEISKIAGVMNIQGFDKLKNLKQ